MEWFRWYHGAISDPKWPFVARKSGKSIGVVVSIWASLLEHASQEQNRGSIEGFNPEAIDALFGYEDETTVTVCNAMRNAGIINAENFISSWEKRQPKRERDDDSSERVRRFREKQKANNSDEVSNGNGNETDGNATVTPSNAQNRTEQNRKDKKEEYCTHKKRKLTGKRLETFNEFWRAFDYPRGKAEAADAWLDIPELTDGLVNKIVEAAKIEAAGRAELVRQGHTPKMAQGWISGRRWEDGKYSPVRSTGYTPEELYAMRTIN